MKATSLLSALGGNSNPLDAQLTLDIEYVSAKRIKLKAAMEQLRAAAAMLQQEEVQIMLTERLMTEMFSSYQSQMGRLVRAIGLNDQHPGFKALIIGFSVGAVSGYLAEITAEATIASIFAPGIAATLPVMLRAARAGVSLAKVSRVLNVFTKINLFGDTANMKRGFSMFIRLLDALGPNALRQFFDKADVAPAAAQSVISFTLRYSQDEQGLSRLKNVAIGLSEDVANRLPVTENPVEAISTMEKIAEDVNYRGGAERLVIVRAENAEAVSRVIGRAMNLGANDPVLRAGFEELFRSVDDIEEFLLMMNRADDDALRAAARLSTCVGR